MDSCSLAIPQVESTVSVNVESVFNEGIIVAFKSSDGCEYRGALLRSTQCSTCSVLTKSVESSLANPLAFLHDHPYSDLQKYTKQISTKMPPNLFLHWNSVPKVDLITSPSSPHKLHSRTRNSKVTNSPQATVVASEYQQKSSEHYTWPYELTPFKQGNVRTAKCLAKLKLKERQDSERGNKSWGIKSQTAKGAGKGRRRSTSVIPGRHRRSPINNVRQSGSIDRTDRRPMSMPPFSKKIAMKRLSLHMNKIPVRVRKKRVSDIDTLSSSSSCSTVDSAIDLSLSLPLNSRSKSL